MERCAPVCRQLHLGDSIMWGGRQNPLKMYLMGCRLGYTAAILDERNVKSLM